MWDAWWIQVSEKSYGKESIMFDLSDIMNTTKAHSG